MYCRQCGTKNDDNAKFCANCGTSMGRPRMAGNAVPPASIPVDAPQKKNNSTKIVVIILALVLILGICVAVFLISKGKKEKEFEEQIVSAEKYLEELDYEKAEAAYLTAIDIDPKQEEPYIHLAEIYTTQNEPEKAKEILLQGYEMTNSEVFEKKLSLYTYVDEVLVPEIGRVETGVYEVGYEYTSQHSAEAGCVQDQSGVINSRIKDFDNDGEDELLVAVLRNEIEEVYTYQWEHNVVFLQMYELKEDEVVLCAEMEACDWILGGADKESTGVFLKEYEDRIYICGGTYQLVYMNADGSRFMSFVVYYENESFVDYAGDREGGAGSEFSGYREDALVMADELDAIDLPEAASDVRETWMLRMTYEDADTDILFRTEGENFGGDGGAFWETGRLETLGKVVIEFWIPEVIEEKEETEH